ncbi:GRIP and coiled-coil domain-containing protein 2 [Diabrotica virgifera virgifera]|uniref:GRIP and coiled-coil domain-containing protein 2 n=1 Tax=Diabrotica virgifera virgifera TaxID=50390 RepID=A0A6P7G022_DIAVI|nr:GRIP and coiled-coil domain-containing protein 2 [Diabrotica virgifera virgifera]
MESAVTNDTNKKSILENLTKEELVKKCTQLLQIAQKAKQSKSTLQEENSKLKTELNKKNTDPDPALQEYIDNLTQQKLNLVTDNQSLKTKNETLSKRIEEYEVQLKECEEKLNTCDNENTSYKRQIRRLTDENEQLIVDLETLEKQLAIAKEKVSDEANLIDLSESKEKDEKRQELEKMLSISLEEIKKLKNENSGLNDKIEVLKINLGEKDKSILTISQELVLSKSLIEEFEGLNKKKEVNEAESNNLNIKLLESENSIKELKENNTKLKQKLKFYHSKIVKFASIAKELKQNKAEILDMFKSYIDQVKEWKDQLDLGEKNIVKYLSSVVAENQALKQKVEEQSKVEDSCSFDNEIKILTDKHENEKSDLQNQLIHSQDQILNITEEIKRANLNISQLTKDIDQLKQNNLDSNKVIEEKDKIINESQALKATYDEEKEVLLKGIQELEYLKENNLDIEESLRESSRKIENLLLEIQELQKQLEEKKKIETDFNSKLAEKQKLENDLNVQISDLEKQIEALKRSKTNVEKVIEDLESQIESLKTSTEEKITSMSTIIQEQENELNILRKENTTLLKIKSDLHEEINKINNEEKDLKEKSEKFTVETQDKLKECEKTVANLQNQVRSFEELERRSTEEIKNIANENKQLTAQNETLQENLRKFQYSLSNRIDCSIQTNEVPYNLDEFEEQVVSLKRENAELLSEMNEMNQAIKERGEIISKLEAHREEVLKKLQIHETQANKNIDNITEKERIIECLNLELQEYKNNRNLGASNEIISLRSEIENLRDRLNANMENSYADNDTLSTSTISRTEEVNRLKDLEGSWEEKYGKLRNLAVKLKGKVRELTQTIAQNQSEQEEAQKKSMINIKTIQNLQNQCDKLEDDLEKSRKECKNLQIQLNTAANDISRDKQQLADKEEHVSTLKVEIENYKKEKQATDNWKKQVGAKIQTLRKELEANNVLKKEFEAKIVTLNGSLENKEQALKAEVESHKHTKNLLEQSNNERKKNSVLSLEMQDYERGAKESTKKLEKQQEEITKLNNQIESQKTTINALREQNKLLENRVTEEQRNLLTVTSEMATYKKQISSLDDDLSQKLEKIHSLAQQLEVSRSETEELSTELCKVIAEHQKTNSTIKSERDQLSNENLRLHQSLREAQDHLKLSKDELKVIQGEYDGYKVRAQSVLRQNQKRDVGLEEKLSEEVASLLAQNSVLSRQLEESKITVEHLEKENSKLSTEIKEYLNKIRELEEDCDEVKTQFADLSTKHEKTVSENAETLRNLKVHADTVSQCYRQQLSDLENRHSREVLELQSRLEKVPTPSETSPVLPTMPRGEGEGSESIDSNSSIPVHPIPLERLLGADSDQEIERIKKKLNEQESKVTHLTALLSDTEQDLVKHIQMNKLLKEEIRRQQRSEEREKHAENLEYLKNVVFKFVTLNSGDERSRLVPVMNTILKLSPEETKELNAVAKGSDLSLKGWSNYLPTWSSPSKPQ